MDRYGLCKTQSGIGFIISEYSLLSQVNRRILLKNHVTSNLIGAGLCIFSKWPIERVFFHAYSSNGYPHLFHQGDWFGGKGVGLAQLKSPNGFKVNVYNTHVSDQRSDSRLRLHTSHVD